MHVPGCKSYDGHHFEIITSELLGQRITLAKSRFSSSTGDPLTPTAATARSAAKWFLKNSIVVVEERREKREADSRVYGIVEETPCTGTWSFYICKRSVC